MKDNKIQSKRAQQRAQQSLASALASLDEPADTAAFLRDLCTPAELQALADRWQVVLLLRDRLPYRKIHDLTGVSVTTIGRVARFLTDGSGGYQAALRQQPKT